MKLLHKQGPQSCRTDTQSSSSLFMKGKSFFFMAYFPFISTLYHCSTTVVMTGTTNVPQVLLPRECPSILCVQKTQNTTFVFVLIFYSWVTNYHMFDGLKQCIISISQFSRVKTPGMADLRGLVRVSQGYDLCWPGRVLFCSVLEIGNHLPSSRGCWQKSCPPSYGNKFLIFLLALSWWPISAFRACLSSLPCGLLQGPHIRGSLLLQGQQRFSFYVI